MQVEALGILHFTSVIKIDEDNKGNLIFLAIMTHLVYDKHTLRLVNAQTAIGRGQDSR